MENNIANQLASMLKIKTEFKKKHTQLKLPQTFQGIGRVCQPHRLLRVLHAPLYMMALRLAQLRHQAQSNCLAYAMKLLTAPEHIQIKEIVRFTH